MDLFKKHSEAVIGVIVYLILVLVLLLFLGLNKPNPIPPEEGIVMDFGGSGGGNPDPGPSNPEPTNTQSENQANAMPNVSNMTQDFEESVSLPTNPNPTESEEQTDNNVAEEETQEEINETVQNITNFNFGNTSDSDANGNGSGNPGTGGDGNSSGDGGGTGAGSGNVAGNGWALDGRSAQSLPAPSVANCDGYVTVNIVVNKSGQVISASAKPGGCTACESHCVTKAVTSAKQARFNADPSAKVRQSGSITYNFRPE
ncbi:MAG: energy transducer TonB [Bacteroidota bacterium]|nr:energy transducer TonB [Bacteroidota bacterium]